MLPMLLRKLFVITSIICCWVTSGSSDFGSQGFDSSRTFSISSNGEAGYPLHLIAAGMRRKTVVFVNVDVYKVGVFISAALDEQVRSQFPATKSCLHLSDPLAEASPQLSADAASLGIVLRFVRDVDSGKIVSAMQEALLPPGGRAGQDALYDAAVRSFMDLLKSATGDAGIKKADELLFLWHSSDAVTVLRNEHFVGSVHNDFLRRRLVDVYVGEQAVAPEVAAAVKRRYQPQS